jgi:hypothetical protein
MPTNLEWPDGVYDRTKPWQSTQERVMQERAFQQGTREKQLEAVALICANVQTRNREIREQMTAPLETPQFGAYKESPTIDDVMAGRFSSIGTLGNRAPTDFSGTPAGQESSSIPSLG